MHQMPASPTSVKIILLIRDDGPPNMLETMSNPKIPMLPQFIAPIMTKRSANLFNIFILLTQLNVYNIYTHFTQKLFLFLFEYDII